MRTDQTHRHGGRAVVAARAANRQPDTEEIVQLAKVAGYDVVATITQRNPEDPGTWIGRGKLKRIGQVAADEDADAVIADGGLTPGQYANFIKTLPAGTALIDRYRLILEIFKRGATDRRAALQVEAATLRYQLPRLRQVTEVSLLNRATEKGSPVLDAERRIDHIESKLASLVEDAAERRQQRRDEGFGLVAIAGYTNAGKTTLLRHLADELSVQSTTPAHPDLDESAHVNDRLFVTLETLTRKGTIDGLPVLYTDTVGFIDALPHDLVESFSATLDEVAAADTVLLVVDATDSLESIREKVEVSLETMDPGGEVIGVLNKVDTIDEMDERQRILEESLDTVVAISAKEGTGIDTLCAQIREALPTERRSMTLPNDSKTQQFLSWAYDRGSVETRYTGESVEVTFESRPVIVDRVAGRLQGMGEPEIEG